jgi:hypothetical protein
MYKFKTTAAEMQEIRIVMAFYFYTRFTHRWSLTSTSLQFL